MLLRSNGSLSSSSPPFFMSKTRRSPDVLKSYWSFKSNRKQDFQAKCDRDYQGDMLGFKPKPRPLLSAWDDKVPSAVLEVRTSLWQRRRLT